MRNQLYIIAILWISTLFSLGLSAQDIPNRHWTSFAYPPSFDHLTVEQGLSQNTIHCILQDRRGFLWFGTDAGLNRYDGLRFQVFHPQKNSPNSLSSDWILALLEDRRGYIWIATRTGGVTILDPETMRMIPIQASSEAGGLPDKTVNALAEDREGNIWLATYPHGLCMAPGNWQMPGKPRFQTFTNADGSPIGRVHGLFCDHQGTLWIGSFQKGLGRLVSNPGDGKLIFHYYPCDLAHSDTSSPYVWSIQEDVFGLLWLGGDNGPFTFDPIDETFHHWNSVEGDASIDLANYRVLGLHRDRADTLWVASDGAGLLKALPRASRSDPVRFKRFAHDPTDPRSVSGDGMQCVFEDRSGVLWANSYQGGLDKLVFNAGRPQDRELPSIFQYRNNAADSGSLSGNNVAAIAEDRFGNLWIGTDGYGLNRVRPPQKRGERMRFERFRADPKHRPGFLQSDVILSIHVDARKQLWLTTFNAGIVRVDQASASAKPTFTHFRTDPKDPNSLSCNFIRCLVDDGHEGFWVGTDGEGLNHFDPRSGRTKRFGWGEGPRVSSHNVIYDMERDDFGTLWLATPAGLNRFNPATEEFRVYRPGGSGSISEELVNTLRIDKGVLWVGTCGGGLNRSVIPPWNGPEPRFKAFGISEGLAGNAVMGILPDGKGNLWLSTDRALCRFDIQEGKGHPFTWQNGLRKAGFIWNSCYGSPSGEPFFGSNDGLTLFHPQDIVPNRIPPSIAITDFQIQNKSLPLWERISRKAMNQDIQEITLKPKDSTFSIDFAALHYAAPEQNRYTFMLEGFDTSWNEASSKHSVSCTTLPPGHYTLHIKGSNCDGIWDDKGLELGIRILPPWYKTWWFQTISAGALLGLIVLVIRYRLRLLRKRNLVLEEMVASRTQQLEEANQALLDQSLTDPLTGLRNRRFLYCSMAEDIAQVQRQQRDSAMNTVDRMKLNIDVLFILVDIDHFKQVNDHHGHLAGDMVLQQMSRILREAARESDILTRWGGEEFLIVARNTARADATILPERIRAAVEAHPFDIGKEQPIHCCCSLGFSVFPFLPLDMSFVSWEQVIEAADACLYAAKHGGRNAWVGIIPEQSDLDDSMKAALAGNVEEMIQSGLFKVQTSINGPIH